MKTRTWLILLAAVPVVLAAALIGAWVMDRNSHEGEVARNVVLDGEAVGGFDDAEVEATVASLSQRYDGQPAELQSDADAVVASNGDLGFSVDQEATVAAVMAAGRSDSLPASSSPGLGPSSSPTRSSRLTTSIPKLPGRRSPSTPPPSTPIQ